MKDSEHFASPTSRIAGRTIGRVDYELRDAEGIFITKPSGYVSPSMVRDTLTAADRFGHRHPGGWSYVVDTSNFIVPNPLNVVHLRVVPHLAHLSQYAIVAPNPLLRTLAQLLKPISHPDIIIRSIHELPPR